MLTADCTLVIRSRVQVFCGPTVSILIDWVKENLFNSVNNAVLGMIILIVGAVLIFAFVASFRRSSFSKLEKSCRSVICPMHGSAGCEELDFDLSVTGD